MALTNIDAEPRLVRVFTRSSRVFSIAAGLVALSALAGWAFDLRAFTAVFPDFVTIKANTAVLIGLLSVGTALFSAQRSPLVQATLGIVVGTVGAATLLQHATGVDLGIDNLLFTDPLQQAGRMSPITATCFVLLGLTLTLWRGERGGWTQGLVLLVLLAMLVVLSSYLYGVRELYFRTAYASVAVPTVFGLSFVGLAILFGHPTVGVMSLVVSQTVAGQLTRRLLPAVVLLPVAVGWVRLLGQQRALYGVEFGVALFALSTVFSLGVLILVVGRSLRAEELARRAAQRTTTEREEDLQTTLDSIGEAVLSTDAQGSILRLNPVATRLTGWSMEDALGKPLAEVFRLSRPDSAEAILFPVERVLSEGHGLESSTEAVLAARDGRDRPVSYTGAPIRDPAGVIRGVVLVFRDLTEAHAARDTLARAQTQLRQGQKMEAVGRLAGGVAHDFNNLMTVILSLTEGSIDELEPNDPIRSDLQEVLEAANRAAALTRQLLTFSRQQVVTPRPTDFNEIVGSVDKMLRRLVGEAITLRTVLPPSPAMVHADPHQLEQVLMNLAINARDAMPSGGSLELSTQCVQLDAGAATPLRLSEGRYVVLTVRDSGEGMDPSLKERIFEPFFTTKAHGQGTGLGLSIVFGIVQQSGGSITVDTALGEGTTFTVYLPLSSDLAPASQPQLLSLPRRMATETILLVDDDAGVRGVARTILERGGYRVIDCGSAGEALLIAEQHRGALDLLVTDVVMPSMNGFELARRLRLARPELKVLAVSGFAGGNMPLGELPDGAFGFLQKPLTPATLGEKVRELLGGGGTGASDTRRVPSATRS